MVIGGIKVVFTIEFFFRDLKGWDNGRQNNVPLRIYRWKSLSTINVYKIIVNQQV